MGRFCGLVFNPILLYIVTATNSLLLLHVSYFDLERFSKGKYVLH
jgi:hypothetical protein